MESVDIFNFECKGIEYGYVLEEALNLIGDFKNIDFDELRNYKIIFPEEYQKYLEENEQKLNGSTIKFKLSEEASEKIDEITNYLAEYWKVRLYRAFTVKIVLKYLYLKLIEKKEF